MGWCDEGREARGGCIGRWVEGGRWKVEGWRGSKAEQASCDPPASSVRSVWVKVVGVGVGVEIRSGSERRRSPAEASGKSQSKSMCSLG